MVVNGAVRLFVTEILLKPIWVKLNELISGKATSLRDIPEEVVEMILLRVPPKSLKRCKGVCKLWRALIDDKLFIEHQLRDHSSSKTSTTVCVDYLSFEKKQRLSLITIQHDDRNSFSQDLRCVVEHISVPQVPERDRKYFPKRLIGSHCDGITCFIEHSFITEEAVFLCNAELGEFKVIHMPPLPNDGMILAGAGFGYDPKSNDYKCIKVFSDVFHFHPNANRAIVYSLSSECWREIKIDLGRCCHLSTQGVYHDGVYYWLNIGRNKMTRTILSFDFSSEEFREIELPKALQRGKRNQRERISKWVECLVILVTWSWPKNSQMEAIEMWVMMFGGDHRWMYLRIAPLDNIYYPLALWKEDELLVHCRDGQLSSYNLTRKTFRTLPLRGFYWSSHAYLYSKTMVSIKQRKEVT